MFIDIHSLLLLAIQWLVQFLLLTLFNDKNVSDIHVWNEIFGETDTYPSFSANERENKRSIRGEIDTCPFFLVKKGFFWGRVNFVTIGPKWKVFEKESW
jgi:hypothetical protein